MNVVFALTLIMLSVSALLTLVRLVRGPSVLDRIVSLDVLVTLIVSALAVHVAANDAGRSVPLLLVLALLGFIGSVTAAHLVGEREDIR
ncbi:MULTISPECIES: monovalent cation/H+ antiporter complex subunit F [unclassified Streptomyces]|uniref:Monovalent cation/H+ antiporter complex subunit F n=1 Tax=Streptomyces johnsoniae TaxID=3075532 RepID=A0ABU2SEZ6_9ACTN|nr:MULTISPECIES: monovalent cation/H+ antiporter complex subunit F [unclassified Streptomyces]MDT0446974.1 monovalent cation/H+ antiporter complex subunit F [Streptomyces sp. DSM 41886]ONK11854.1 putative monovalent cation/H+ antiporter subunitF [Streptomyces sp. MP131-18]